jgi:hypothetical protein
MNESNDEIRRQVSLKDYIGQYTQLKGRPGKEQKGPCPFCGGTDRFSIFKDDIGWMCRGCNPRAGDIFTFVMRMHNCDFKEARNILGYGTEKRNIPTPTRTQPKKEMKELEFNTEEWQAKNKGIIKAAVNAIKGSATWDYLEARGIDDEAIKAFALGHKRMKSKDLGEYDCLVIPWILKDKRVTMTKYRRLVADQKMRYFTESGSTPVLFGSHLATGKDIVIMVEGELNCISVWMAASDLADILSVGGDSLVEQMVDCAKGYDHRSYWVDSEEKARKIQELDPTCGIVHVSYANGHDHGGDANEILQHFGLIPLRIVITSLLNRT